MSRIQDILSKAERDGTTRRTRSIGDDYAGRPALDQPRTVRPAVDETRARGPVDAPDDELRVRAPQPVEAPRLAPALVDVPRVTRSFRGDSAPAAAAVADLDPIPGPRDHGEYDAAAGVSPERPDTSSDVGAVLDHHLVAALAPTSIAAEQYRSLRTRLKRAESGRSLRVIAVTSPAKGDGKSLTAANLALTMAQEFQQRVLLLDGDLRRPAVHRLFGLTDGPGLGEVLMDVAPLEQALVYLPDHHLTVLPAGVPPSQPAELLGSATMRRVLDTLRTRFDRILIDVPPVAPLADLHILAPLVDGLLMIIRAGITPKPAIERALAGLDASKVLGLVLNESGSQGTDTYNYEGYGYLAG
ncbi:MAG: CpsD/CapB family tyrosine-protein kinase, partial [Vicinamibacterales bacterium]